VIATTPFSSALLPLSQAAGHAFFNEGPLALAMVSMTRVDGRRSYLLCCAVLCCARLYFMASNSIGIDRLNSHCRCQKSISACESACILCDTWRPAITALCCAMACCDFLCCAVLQVYNHVLSWPPPVPGSSMCLPVGAGVINARLPRFCIMPPPQPTVDPAVQVSTPLPHWPALLAVLYLS
jgi:hypothetical protein